MREPLHHGVDAGRPHEPGARRLLLVQPLRRITSYNVCYTKLLRLSFQLLARLELDGEKVVKEERLFKELSERIRDVRQGPDGYLYMLTDADDA